MATATATVIRFFPVHDRVIVKPCEPPATYGSGIVIPESAKRKPTHGLVVAVGPGKRDQNSGKRIPMDIEVGDTVHYGSFCGYTLEHPGDKTKYVVLAENECLAVESEEVTHDVPN
jgi:chaperonin GroES